MERQDEKEIAARGIAKRLEDYKKVYSETHDHRAAIRAYCLGNKWL